MQQINVRFTDAEQVRSFINMIDKFEIDFNMGTEKRYVDAKSILRIITLDLSKP